MLHSTVYLLPWLLPDPSSLRTLTIMMFSLLFIVFLTCAEISESFVPNSSVLRKNAKDGAAIEMTMKLLEVKVPLQSDVSQYEHILKLEIPQNNDILRWYILAIEDKNRAVIEVLVDER